ncbi:response regulator [Flavobacterium sp.]|uniref:response regulator n=1 Tax=Flavobacterium sp. TaxID=239 RepID=UPI00286D899F|nr:response regulator [Flavobacterium sp.]
MKKIISLLLLFSNVLFAQYKNDNDLSTLLPYEITNENFDSEITSSFSYLFTKNNELNLKEVLKFKNKFTKDYSSFKSKKKIDYPTTAFFIGKIQNKTSNTLKAVFNTSNSQKVAVFIISETDTIKKTIGYVQESDSTYSKEKSNSFCITFLPNQTKTIVLKQKNYSDYDLIFKFNIMSTAIYDSYLLGSYRKFQLNRMFLGILSGGILLLFLFNLVLFFNTKTKYYLYYTFYLFFVFILIILMIDRNQNFFSGRIMLYFELIKEIAYTLSIVTYGLFAKSLLEISNTRLTKFVKVFTTITSIYLLYLIVIFFKNDLNFDEAAYLIIKIFKFLTFGFLLIFIMQLYKNKSNKYLKYVFIGSVILFSSYLLQTFFENFQTILFSKHISKQIVRTNLSILLGTIIEILFFSYALHLKSYKATIDKKVLENLNELKSRFFANISHEFRTPLTLIKSPVQSLKSKTNDENQLKELALIDNNSNRMLELVDQLLELSKLDSGNLKLILKDGNIANFLHTIIEPFQFQASENNLNFVSNIEKSSQNYSFDKDIIQKIATNLLSNAFKYTLENETITFEASIENQELKLKITNSGTEIKKEDLPQLFERFYQKKDVSQGVGIGLSLVQELVDLYEGKIITNIENNVLSFTVFIPLNNVSNAILIPLTKNIETISNEINSENDLPILLIVDDNQDIRNVIATIFQENYTIIQAQDGEEAYKLAQKEIPDCIVSDVVMPKMDGFEFTKAIKNNELTSFIPIVLLTAKSSDEYKLEGLQSTADAFLTKPFNNEILEATVNQLIAERKKLQKRYSQELVLRPVDLVINSVDEKFIEKLQVVLDKNLSNSEFTSENFSTAVGMSRMQLHRKLKSLLGVTATEFLRNERLKTASELLKKGNGNISDVAYAVGFNDVSYFSKCFKEMYQCTPSEMINK